LFQRDLERAAFSPIGLSRSTKVRDKCSLNAKTSRSDYESLRPEDAQAVRTARARIRIPIKQTTTALITIGVELRVVKKILGHGRGCGQRAFVVHKSTGFSAAERIQAT
jgi:hypothetical protein